MARRKIAIIFLENHLNVVNVISPRSLHAAGLTGIVIHTDLHRARRDISDVTPTFIFPYALNSLLTHCRKQLLFLGTPIAHMTVV